MFFEFLVALMAKLRQNYHEFLVKKQIVTMWMLSLKIDCYVLITKEN